MNHIKLYLSDGYFVWSTTVSYWHGKVQFEDYRYHISTSRIVYRFDHEGKGREMIVITVTFLQRTNNDPWLPKKKVELSKYQ